MRQGRLATMHYPFPTDNMYSNPFEIDTPHIKAPVTVPKIFHVFIGWGLAAIDQFPTVSLVLENLLTCNKNQHKQRNVQCSRAREPTL